MALTTQSAGIVRQKAMTSASIVSGAVANAQCNYWVLKALFLHLSANKGNPDLKIVSLDGNATASDGGNTADQVVSDSACTLYAIFAKKTGSTATWLKLTNHGSTNTTNGGQDISIRLTTAAESNLLIFPDGKAMGTGLVYTEDTTATGSTLNLLANRIDGFVIVGA